MSGNTKGLHLPLQKVIELGKVDGWFRGMSNLTPVAVQTAEDLLEGTYDLNTHVLTYGSLITPDEIAKTIGFRRLLQSCARNDVRVEISAVDAETLRVHFDPPEPFSKSIVFGARYTNVQPFTLPPKNLSSQLH
jgi:hypothetical protein